MKIGMTLMVRDEADVISANIEYYLGQGVDVILVTDNGSVDGTTEILRSYERSGAILLRHDPVHRKQQSSVVTGMARALSAEHNVDWVINSDADEFLMPRDRSITLRAAFERIAPSIGSFVVPVVNMIGPMARRGTRLDTMVWRDQRSESELARVGLSRHPTGNAIHVASDDVTVGQGNHEVSIASMATASDDPGLEVLHFPWRSWEQYKNRVETSGRAYLVNTSMSPSPNHHGMTDFARLESGILLPYFAARLPAAEVLANDSSFVFDDGLVGRLGELPSGDAGPVAFDREFEDVARAAGLELIARDLDTRSRIAALQSELATGVELIQRHEADLADSRSQVVALRARRAVRIADAIARSTRRLRYVSTSTRRRPS